VTFTEENVELALRMAHRASMLECIFLGH